MWHDCLVDSSRDRLAGVLTVAAWSVLGLCAVALLFGSVPGVDVQDDASNWLGRAFAGLGDMHYRGHECTPLFVHRYIESAGGTALWMALGPIVLAALYVRWRPYPEVAFACAGMAVFAAAVMAALTLDIDVFGLRQRVDLWPAYVMNVAIAAIAGVLALALVSMPGVLIARAVRRRAARRAMLPVLPQAVALPQRVAEAPDAAPGE
jgi:hypothetical protein